MTTTTLVSASSPASSARPGWRIRWRHVRELLSGALILAIWLSLWTWVTVGVAAPLGRIDADLTSTRSTAADLRT
jgi:hypothetical protein